MSLLTRLAWRSLRHRPWQALLLLFALCLSTTTLTLALAVSETADGAWDRVFAATKGAHVTLKARYAENVDPARREQLRAEQFAAQSTAPGVVAASGPWPLLFTTGEVGSTRMELRLQVRAATSSVVDQPLLVSGRWLDGGDGVVLEDGLATTMRVGPGGAVTIAGQRLPVRGTAMTMSIFRFPKEDPALIWISPAAAARLDPAAVEYGYDWIDLRLANPADAAIFAPAGTAGPEVNWDVETWQDRRAANRNELEVFGTALLIVGTMLAALTVSTAAVLVAWRVAAQTRQVGVLKAVGATPWQVTGALLVEYLAVAGLAVAVGLTAGTFVAPLLARSVRTLYGAPQAPPITWSRAAAATALALAVVLLATVRPALRGIRHSTLRSLTAAVRAPRRSSRLARFANRFGLPLLAELGLRTALRRPGRTLATTLGTALALAMVTSSLALDRKVREIRVTVSGSTDLNDVGKVDLYQELRAVVLVAAALLLALAVVNAIITAAFAARDSARNHAILRALGATPGQTVTALVIAQVAVCLLAGVIGIPLGVALFAAAGGGEAALSPTTYLAVILAATLLYALIVSIPARLLARPSIAPTLTYE